MSTVPDGVIGLPEHGRLMIDITTPHPSDQEGNKTHSLDPVSQMGRVE